MNNFKFNFTSQQVREFLKNNSEAEEWFIAMNTVLPKWDINSVERVSGFLSQCAHESNNFRSIVENLNYSAVQLNKVFSKYFARAGRDAKQFERQPEKIANIVYANRLGNGNSESGEGWKFRGRGLIQLTGKTNYSNFASYKKMSLDEVISYLQTKEGALESACWFWNSRNINRAADSRDIKTITKLVNGGENGLADRTEKWERALVIFGSSASSSTNNNTKTVARPSRTLRRGDRGSDVKSLQEKLKIAADGIFGVNTENSLRSWQVNNGLTPTGVASESTLVRMFG
jgi:putative chitinase